MPRIRILPEDCEIELREHETILQASLRTGIPHVHACGGNARCSTCRVIIVSDPSACLPRTDKASLLAQRLSFGPEIRLACQTSLASDAVCRRLVLDEQDLELTQADFLAAGPGAVGQERRLALLFADIRGFTSLAESLPPYDVVHILNRYFLQMGKVIGRNNGIINNYMGDGFMALFGVDSEDNIESRAVTAGLEMLTAVKELQPYFQSAYKISLTIGIGIHVGDVVVGRIGAHGSKSLTAIGDAVNFASRIEAANKEHRTSLLISDETHQAVAHLIETGRTLNVPIKGKTGVHRLYEVLSERSTR